MDFKKNIKITLADYASCDALREIEVFNGTARLSLFGHTIFIFNEVFSLLRNEILAKVIFPDGVFLYVSNPPDESNKLWPLHVISDSDKGDIIIDVYKVDAFSFKEKSSFSLEDYIFMSSNLSFYPSIEKFADALYSSLCEAAPDVFVSFIYLILLNRLPDHEGYQSVTSRIKSNEAYRMQFILDTLHGSEFKLGNNIALASIKFIKFFAARGVAFGDELS